MDEMNQIHEIVVRSSVLDIERATKNLQYFDSHHIHVKPETREAMRYHIAQLINNASFYGLFPGNFEVRNGTWILEKKGNENEDK